MQIVPVPLFDKNMVVQAYVFRYQQGNDLFSTTQATNVFDGASRSLVLETLNLVGLDAFTLGKPVFVPINHIMLLGDLASQCTLPPEKIIFLLEEPPRAEEPYLSSIAGLCEKGFRFAIGGLDTVDGFEELLQLCTYVFLSQKDEKAIADAKLLLRKIRMKYHHLELVATYVNSKDLQEQLSGLGYSLYESRFFKVPITQKSNKVSPMKANSIRLINIVQDENFEFEHVTEIVQGDPSLTISLLRLVNNRPGGSRNKIKTINQAVAMLGQQEVRKWVTTAVSRSLGDDRPNEITRISLVRAKFAENLAQLFELAHMAQGLFLMGLFSVLDIILEVTMEEALKMVQVSDTINDALLKQDGVYYPVLNLIADYEGASWASVSRLMIVHDLQEDDIHKAYVDALVWYKNLIIEEEQILEAEAAKEDDKKQGKKSQDVKADEKAEGAESQAAQKPAEDKSKETEASTV